VHEAVERGMDWLGKSKENKADGYYLYSIERAGVASGSNEGRGSAPAVSRAACSRWR
jgi:hypothetical protein